MDKPTEKMPITVKASEPAVISEEKAKERLNKESTEIVNKIICENDTEKQKDLVYLFNANQTKKTVARLNKLNDLMDTITGQAIKRWTEKPDQRSNQDLLNGLKITQDLLEKSQAQINGVESQPAPLIQINQQNNNITAKDPVSALSRDSRDRVKAAVEQLRGSLNLPTAAPVVDVSDKDMKNDEEEASDATNEENEDNG